MTMNPLRFLICIFSALGARLALASEAVPAIEEIDRFVAIDNACAWPQLTLLPNGVIAALIWPYPNHGFNEGAVECWTSQDAGKSWKFAGVPVVNGPGVARLNVGGGVSDHGAYIALVGGFGDKPSVAGAGTYKIPRGELRPIAPAPAVSHDYGRTWKLQPTPVMQQPDGRNLVPYGRIESLGDGELGVMAYLDELVFYVTKDDGVSWQKRGVVTTGKRHNESAWLRLQNGDLYTAARTWDDGHVDGLRSTDRGATWVSEGPLTLPRQHPADLLKLPDGRVVLSYATRNQGLWSICLRFADASARGWSEPVLLVNMEDATDRAEGWVKKDGGYPSTVLLSDGTFVTAYYSKGMPAHRRYHVGVIRWRMKPAAKTSARNAGE